MKQPAQATVAANHERFAGHKAITGARSRRFRFSLLHLLSFVAILGVVLGVCTGAYRVGYQHGRTDAVRISADLQLSVYESWWRRDHPGESFPTDWP